ncbi:MAG: alpha/beta hydrolase [Bergeyella sp.]
MLYFEAQQGGKEPFVLLHGFMENLSIWNDMEKDLSKDFSLLKIDLPGHGNSDVLADVQTMEMMAEEVKKVLDCQNLSKVHLLGHSMGGYVSLAFAEKYPELLKSITLFFSTSLADNDEKKDIRRRSIEVIDQNFSFFVSNSIPNLFSENEKDILEEKINFAKEIALKTNIQGVKASQLGMVERPDRTHILKNFEGKILIIAGKHDNAVKTSDFIRHIPDRTNIKTYILDCGHNGQWEKPEICAAIINTELLHNLPEHLVL